MYEPIHVQTSQVEEIDMEKWSNHLKETESSELGLLKKRTIRVL
jgi:hypothetical protein